MFELFCEKSSGNNFPLVGCCAAVCCLLDLFIEFWLWFGLSVILLALTGLLNKLELALFVIMKVCF
jgi:hypothetical protein